MYIFLKKSFARYCTYSTAMFFSRLSLFLAAVGAEARWLHQDSVVRRAADVPQAVGASNATVPVVDLGYAKYQGYHNSSFNNSAIYKG
jgi:hypothetical protein